jgi:hypothetical protein
LRRAHGVPVFAARPIRMLVCVTLWRPFRTREVEAWSWGMLRRTPVTLDLNKCAACGLRY